MKIFDLKYVWTTIMKVCLVCMALLVILGNAYLAVINYQLQDANLFEKFDIYANQPIQNPEGFALAIHIMTLTLGIAGLLFFLLYKRRKTTIPMTRTQRGFASGKFRDHYGSPCSIQKSSLATIDAIWLGVDDPDPKIMCVDADRLGIPRQAQNGWQPYDIPKEVLVNTRMHLTRKHVKKLLPVLKHFAETGDLK